MKIPVPDFGQAQARPLGTQYSNLSFEDGTNTLVQGIGQLTQGVQSIQSVNEARAQKAREKAIAAASDSGFAQAQERTTNELDGYDEAPESKPEGTTSIDTLTVEDLATAGGPGKHVPGFLDTRGNEAYEKASDTTTRLQKFYDSLLASAPNEETKAHLGKRLDGLKASVQHRIAVHEGQQLKVAAAAGTKALLDTTLRTAGNLYNDDEKLKPFVDDALASLKRSALPEEYEAQKTAYLAQVSKVMISKYIAAGDLDGAEARLKTDSEVLGDEAPKVTELIATKKKAAHKQAAELTSQAAMDRTARSLSNPYGFIAEGDLNKLRDEANARYPEDKEEAKRTAEEWIRIERERKKATVGEWINQARIQRRNGGTKAITKDLLLKIEQYGEDQGLDYLERIAEDDRKQFDRYEAKTKGRAASAAADREQAKRNKLALTRMQALPYAKQAAFEEEVGFEGQGLDEQGKANLQRQQQLARNLNEKGFDRAKEALDNDIEKIATDKKLKGEDPGTQFELRGDAAAELEIFLQQNDRAPTAGERAKILSEVALKRATKPRVLDSLRGPGQEFPFQQKKRQGAALGPRDQQAVDWARVNPGDPRAAAILKKNGVQ